MTNLRGLIVVPAGTDPTDKTAFEAALEYFPGEAPPICGLTFPVDVYPVGRPVEGLAPPDILTNLSITPTDASVQVTIETSDPGDLYWHVQDADDPAPSGADIEAGTNNLLGGAQNSVAVDIGVVDFDIPDIGTLPPEVSHALRLMLVKDGGARSNVPLRTFARAAPSYGAYGTVVMSQNPLHFYTAVQDGDWIDAASSAKDAPLNTATAVNSYWDGDSNLAIIRTFSGDSSIFKAGSFPESGPYSVFAWVWRGTLGPGFVMCSGDNADNGWAVFSNNGRFQLVKRFADDSGNSNQTNTAVDHGTGDRWSHIGYTISETGVLRRYQDGVMFRQDTDAGGWLRPNGPDGFIIGARRNAPTTFRDHANSNTTGLAVFNRQLLDAEVLAQFQAATPPEPI